MQQSLSSVNKNTQIQSYISNAVTALVRTQAQVTSSGSIVYNPLSVRRIDVLKELIDTWYTLSSTILQTAKVSSLKQEFCERLIVAMQGKVPEPTVRSQKKPEVKIPEFNMKITSDPVDIEIKEITLEMKRIKLESLQRKEELTIRKMEAEIQSLQLKALKDQTDAKLTIVKAQQQISDYETSLHTKLQHLEQKENHSQKDQKRIRELGSKIEELDNLNSTECFIPVTKGSKTTTLIRTSQVPTSNKFEALSIPDDVLEEPEDQQALNELVASLPKVQPNPYYDTVLKNAKDKQSRESSQVRVETPKERTPEKKSKLSWMLEKESESETESVKEEKRLTQEIKNLRAGIKTQSVVGLIPFVGRKIIDSKNAKIHEQIKELKAKLPSQLKLNKQKPKITNYVDSVDANSPTFKATGKGHKSAKKYPGQYAIMNWDKEISEKVAEQTKSYNDAHPETEGNNDFEY